MRISVIIPTHRRGDRLAGALTCIGGQTDLPHEVLVVDDDPTGEARAAVEAWTAARSAADPPEAPVTVHYLENPQGDGPSGSRNLGAAEATGDWLAFLDDDDRWEPGYLAQVQACGARGDVVLTPLRRTVHNAAGGSIRTDVRALDPAMTSEQVIARNPGVTGSNLAITRAGFQAVGGYDTAMVFAEDTDLLARILATDLAVVVAPDSLAHQVVHPGERLSSGGSRRLGGVEAFLRKHYRDASPAARRRMQFRYWGARKSAAETPLDRNRFRLYAWSTAEPDDLVRRVQLRVLVLVDRLRSGPRTDAGTR